jgi:hypothetical protein
MFAAGTQAYGLVKKVGRTSVVTTFSMLQFIPVSPVQSFYFLGKRQTKTMGVPFAFQMTTESFAGIPLAQTDRASVVMAYLRALLAVAGGVGFIGTLVTLIGLGGAPPGHAGTEAIQRVATGFVFSFIAGAGGGLLTYVLPQTPLRERDIRKYCGELLGICVDPGLVRSEHADAISKQAKLSALGKLSGSNPDERFKLIRELVAVRAQLAHGKNVGRLETDTDEILDCLQRLKSSTELGDSMIR